MSKLPTALLLITLFVSCKNSSNKPGYEISNLKLLVSPADSLCAEPYLFTDKNGLVYLSWIEKRKDRHSLKFSSLINREWSKPVEITSGNNWFVNWADYPVLTSDGDDNMLAHILEKSESSTYTYDIKIITSNDSGNSWSNTKILHEDGKRAEHGFVSTVPYNDQYFISWLDGRNTAMEGAGGHQDGHHGQMTLRGAIVNVQGLKSSEWELDNRVCDCCQTCAVITTEGPVVVYRDRSEDEIRDISIVRYVHGAWTTPKPIFSDNWKITGCPVNGPRADAQGNNLAVAWFSAPDKKGQVNIVFSRDGGASFDPPIRIDEGKGIGRVDVIMLDDKCAMVSWMEGAVIKATRVNNDGSKEPSFIIASSSESRSSGFPQMTRSGNEIFFAWSDNKTKTIRLAKLSL